MAFKIYSTDDNRVPGIEYLPASAITPKVGMALTQTTGQLAQTTGQLAQTTGQLALATGATAPTYISMCEKDGECTAGDIIPVIRVGKDMILETTFAAAANSIKLGDKVTLHTDGLQVTATTTNGVAEVVYMDGTASGSMCRVRF